MKKHNWLIAANGSCARFFTVEGSVLKEEYQIEHPESRMKNSDFVSDRPGRDFESNGLGTRHSLEQKVTPKEHETILFAREIAKKIDGENSEKKLSRLYIAASPSFLGILRKELPPHLLKIVTEERNKDLTTLPISEISSHFTFSSLP